MGDMDGDRDGFIKGAAIGGAAGAAVAGLPGMLVGGGAGGLLGLAYAQKPVVENFSTSLQNDLAPETVTLDAHQIYVRITTGPGSGSLVEAKAAADELASSFAERAGQVARARSVAASAWEGQASAAASAAATPLDESFAVARQQLAANAQALDAEIAAFDHIRSQVEPVPPTPPQSGVANAVNPFQTDTDAAINAYNAMAAKNIQLYEGYVADTGAARGQVPREYAQPAPLLASAAAVTRTGSPIGNTAVPPPQVGGGGAGEPAAATAANAAGGAGSGAGAGAGSAGAGAGGGSGSGGGVSGGAEAGRQSPSLTTPSATAPGGVPLVPPVRDAFTSAPLAGRPPRTTDTQRGFTAGGGGGGVGAFGPGVGATAGPTPRGQVVAPGPVVGQSPTPAPPPPGRGPGGAPVPPARGATGPAGLPMGAPGGRANGDEDEEHRRKYRVEPDDKELFGVDEPYVPPVIGDRR